MENKTYIQTKIDDYFQVSFVKKEKELSKDYGYCLDCGDFCNPCSQICNTCSHMYLFACK